MSRTTLYISIVFFTLNGSLGQLPGRCPPVHYNGCFEAYDRISSLTWNEIFSYDDQPKAEICKKYYLPSSTYDRLSEDKFRIYNTSDFTRVITTYPTVSYNNTKFGDYWIYVPECCEEQYKEGYPRPLLVKSLSKTAPGRRFNMKVVYFDRNWLALWSCEQINEEMYKTNLQVLRCEGYVVIESTISKCFQRLDQLGFNTSLLVNSGYNETICDYYNTEFNRVSKRKDRDSGEENGKSGGHEMRLKLSYSFCVISVFFLTF